MAEYRLYCLNEEGGFAKVDEIEATGDADAVSRARAMKKEVPCELWSGNRLVARLPAYANA